MNICKECENPFACNKANCKLEGIENLKRYCDGNGCRVQQENLRGAKIVDIFCHTADCELGTRIRKLQDELRKINSNGSLKKSDKI